MEAHFSHGGDSAEGQETENRHGAVMPGLSTRIHGRMARGARASTHGLPSLSPPLCLTACGKFPVVESDLFPAALVPEGRVRPMRNVAVAEPDPRLRTQFLKVRARQCRYIVSDDVKDAICCGAPISGTSSWCPWHRRIVYVPSLGSQKQKANFKDSSRLPR
jgi:hypothetical protein